MPLRVSQTHPRSQCCRIPQCMHQCATHECVGAHGTPYATVCFTCCVFAKMCLQPHPHGLHLCQSSMRRRRPNHLSLLTLIHNPKLHFQHPQLMMNPCHFTTMMIHHHGSIKNPKHSGFPPSSVHQRSFHSKCRHHPCRFLRHGSRTCPLVIQSFRRHRGSTKLHRRHQQPDEDILPLAHSFDETPPLKAAQVPETPTIPSVAKRWRSGTLHLENPASKRWRSDTLHPETPVPATTPPQLRWRAGVWRASRPFRRLRDKQSDPSEARVKRPPLAPAQVMSTALEKGWDYSLGFDGRGPVFDEINKD